MKKITGTFLGIDLGTSAVKIVLMDGEQNILAQSSAPLTVSQPQPLWSEQNPAHWWEATCSAIQQLQATHIKELSQVQAIGLSGQQHGATLLNAKNEVLRPAMLWNDGRSFAECAILAEAEPDYQKITGNLIMPGFTAPKLLWVARHEPNIFHEIAKVLLPKDYLRWKMTGAFVSDMSDASGTAWLDVGHRCWSDSLLLATGLTQRHMPDLCEGCDISATLTPEVAKLWKVPAGTPVVGGAGDNAATAISLDVIKPGSAFLSLGTSGVYFVANQNFLPNPPSAVHTFCHCLPHLWHQMSVHLSAASCLDWLADLLSTDIDTLLLEAEQAAASHETVLFLPYLSGERTPHNNPHAKGTFFGLTSHTKRADMTRAVLEGVAFAFADGQEAIIKAGTHIEEVSVVGGGAKSLFWGEILASVLNRPLTYRSNREASAAFGAARLAWLSITKADAFGAFIPPLAETVVWPQPAHVKRYTAKRQLFQTLYQQLKTLFEDSV
ncbi:MAG: xylulokinase [Gammaproteobacteria bacterium]